MASFFLRREGEGSLEYAKRVFGRVFGSDIERVIGMAVSDGMTAGAMDDGGGGGG